MMQPPSRSPLSLTPHLMSRLLSRLLFTALALAGLTLSAPTRAHNYFAGYMHLAGMGQKSFPPASEAELQRLLAMAKSPDRSARMVAAGALGQTGRVEAVEPLTALLYDSDAEVRVVAAFAFSGIRDRRAADAILNAIRHPRPWESQGDWHEPTVENPQETIGLALVSIEFMGPEILPAIVDVLTSPVEGEADAELRVKLEQHLAMSASAVPAAALAPYEKIATDPKAHPLHRRMGLAALQRSKAPEARATLERLFLSGDADISQGLATSPVILTSKNPAVHSRLWALATAGKEPVRGEVREALARSKDKRLLESALREVSGKDSARKAEAIRALAWYGDPRAVRALTAAAREAGATGDLVRDVLARRKNPVALPILLADLMSPKQYRREVALRSLGEPGNRAAVPALLGQLGKEAWVRGLAIEALGKIGDRRATLPLLKLLDRHGPVVIIALSGLKDPAAAKPLAAYLRKHPVEGRAYTDEGAMQDAMADAFAACGPAAVPPLLSALKDPSPRVRARAAAILGSFREISTVAPLIAALKDRDAGVRAAAAASLIGHRDARLVAPLTVAMGDASAAVRYAAARGLALQADARALNTLRRALADDNLKVRYAAAVALGNLGDKRGTGVLLSLLEPGKGGDTDTGRLQLSAIGLLGAWKEQRASGRIIGILGEDFRMSVFDSGDPNLFALLSNAKVKALSAITGQDFGHAYYRWMAWGLRAGVWTPPPPEAEEE